MADLTRLAEPEPEPEPVGGAGHEDDSTASRSQFDDFRCDVEPKF